jgi:hypothetical protein
VAVNFPIEYVRPSYEDKASYGFECAVIGGNKLDVEALCDLSVDVRFAGDYHYKMVPVEITSLRRTPLY